jgi:hypothetical protein
MEQETRIIRGEMFEAVLHLALLALAAREASGRRRRQQ